MARAIALYGQPAQGDGSSRIFTDPAQGLTLRLQLKQLVTGETLVQAIEWIARQAPLEEPVCTPLGRSQLVTGPGSHPQARRPVARRAMRTGRAGQFTPDDDQKARRVSLHLGCAGALNGNILVTLANAQ